MEYEADRERLIAVEKRPGDQLLWRPAAANSSYDRYVLGKTLVVTKPLVIKAEHNYSADLAHFPGERVHKWAELRVKRIETAGPSQEIILASDDRYVIVGVSQYFRNFGFGTSNLLGMVLTLGLTSQTSKYREIYLQNEDGHGFVNFSLRMITDRWTAIAYKNEAKYFADRLNASDWFKIRD